MADMTSKIILLCLFIYRVWDDSKIYRYNEERLWNFYLSNKYRVRMTSFTQYKVDLLVGFYVSIILIILIIFLWP